MEDQHLRVVVIAVPVDPAQHKDDAAEGGCSPEDDVGTVAVRTIVGGSGGTASLPASSRCRLQFPSPMAHRPSKSPA